MCNQCCRNFCGCGCANSLALLWLGASLGRRCCDRSRRCCCNHSCSLSGCTNFANSCSNDGFDCYYARQFGLLSCDHCRRCNNSCGCDGTGTTRSGCGCNSCRNNFCNNCWNNCWNNCSRSGCGCNNCCTRNTCGC